MKRIFGCSALALFVLSGCGTTEQITVNISAAASMQNALEDVETMYEAENENVDLQINYGGSGTLVTQIEEGAPTDIFISASESNFKVLEDENLILNKVNLLKNELVLITNEDKPVESLSDAASIAIGTPDAVPAGTYAVQSLKNSDLYDKYEDKLIQAKDVTEVLSYVASGNADIGAVYNTDAISSDQVKVITAIDDSLHDPIIYPMGTLTKNEGVSDVYDYLQSDEAIKVFEEYGFVANE